MLFHGPKNLSIDTNWNWNWKKKKKKQRTFGQFVTGFPEKYFSLTLWNPK
jgi:hypothetical protein